MILYAIAGILCLVKVIAIAKHWNKPARREKRRQKKILRYMQRRNGL